MAYRENLTLHDLSAGILRLICDSANTQKIYYKRYFGVYCGRFYRNALEATFATG